MRKKFYFVLLMLLKDNVSIASTYFGFAETQEDAIQKAVTGVTSRLLEGFAITTKTVEELSANIVPANSGFDCCICAPDGIPQGVYIDLRKDYDEDFKRDLQEFISKHFVNLPPIYKEYI
jgi:hypothetical protein